MHADEFFDRNAVLVYLSTPSITGSDRACPEFNQFSSHFLDCHRIIGSEIFHINCYLTYTGTVAVGAEDSSFAFDYFADKDLGPAYKRL
jgi:hypothetical protein